MRPTISYRDDLYVVTFEEEQSGRRTCVALTADDVRALVAELARAGFRADDDRLAATERHLADMRRLVFTKEEKS